MIYNFNSKNNDIHFIIDGDEEYETFCNQLNEIDDTGSFIYYEIQKSNTVYVDKKDTKYLCDKLGKHLNSMKMFNHINGIFNGDICFHCMMRTMYIIQFHNFIRKTHGGFVISRSEN